MIPQRLRRVLAGMLACCFAGCGVSAQTTGGQLDQIKPGMTREQVVGSLGEPAQTDLVNGEPSKDLYACDEKGQIMVVKESLSPLSPLYIIPLVGGAALVVDETKRSNLIKRARKCAVNYDQGRAVSTTQTNGIVYTK